MTITSEERKGWMVSITFHLLLLVIFFGWKTATPALEFPREVELAFLPAAIPIEREAVISAPVPAARRANPAPVSPRIARVPPVNHGSRRTAPAPQRSAATGAMPSPAAKEQPVLRAEPAPSPSAAGAGSPAPAAGAGSSAPSTGPAAGTGGTGVSPLIDWTGGVTRQRIAGGMPGFPEGQHREMQIVARFVVAPDGQIRDITLVRKGDPRYEERVLAAMRGWRFNRLPAGVEQADQTGKATFLFKLK